MKLITLSFKIATYIIGSGVVEHSAIKKTPNPKILTFETTPCLEKKDTSAEFTK